MFDLVPAPLFPAFSDRTRFFLSTAIISLGLAAFACPGTGFSQQQYLLDNGADPDALDQQDGDWRPDSEIWVTESDHNDGDYTDPRATGAGPGGRVVVMPSHTTVPGQEVTLRLYGNASGADQNALVVSGIRVVGSGYTLRGATAETELRGAIVTPGNPASRRLGFALENDEVLNIENLRLGGRVVVSGNGTVNYEGDSTTSMLLLTVGAGTQFNSTGTTAGVMTNNGIASIANHGGNVTNNSTLATTGTVRGNVANNGTGTATLSGVVTGVVANRGREMSLTGPLITREVRNENGAVLNIGELTEAADDLRLTTQDASGAQVRGRLVNSATVGLRGDMYGNIVNGALGVTGRVNLIGGSVNGTVTNNRNSVINGTGAISQELVNNGIVNVQGGAVGERTLTVGQITNQRFGDINVATDHSVVSTGNVINGGDIVLDGTLGVTGTSQVENGSQGVLTVNGGGRLNGRVVNDGRLISDGVIAGNVQNRTGATADLSGTISGDVTNSGTGRLTTTGNLAVNALSNEGTGRMSVGSGHELSIAGGAGTLRNSAHAENNANIGLDLAGTLRGSLANSGTTILGGLVPGATAVVDGSITNSGRIILRRNSEITGNFTNSGQVQSLGSQEVRVDVAGAFRNMSGALLSANSGRVDIYADRIYLAQGGRVEGNVHTHGTTINGGTLLLNRDQARSAALINDASGSVVVSANIDASGFRTENNGDFLIESGGTYRNVAGFQNNDQLTIRNRGALTATNLVNGADGDIVNQGTISATLRNAGTVTNTGRISGDVINNGILNSSNTVAGSVTNNRTATLSGQVTGNLLNNGTTNTGGNLQVARLQNNGTVQIRDGHQLRSTSPVENRSRINVAGTLIGNVGNLIADSRVEMQGGTVEGALSNRGIVTGNGTITGRLTNAGTGRIALTAGQRLEVGGDTLNSGRAVLGGTLAGDLNNLAPGIVALSGNGGVDGSVTNSGTLSGNGVVTGNLHNRGAGSLSLSGSVGGRLTQDSSQVLETTGTLTVGSLANNSFTRVATGTTLNATNGTVNSRGLTVSGLLTGSVNNAAGAATHLNAGGTIRGAFTNSGTVTGTGLIDGGVGNLGGARFSMNGQVTGVLTNQGELTQFRSLQVGQLINSSTVSVQSGAVLQSDARVDNGGTLTVANNATLRGDVLNRRGRSVTVGAGGQITGDIENNGALRSNGTIAGDIGNNGSLNSTGTILGDVINNRNATAALAGRVDGRVTNNGNLWTEGDLIVDGLTNTNLATIGTGHVLYTETQVENSAVLDVLGRIVTTGPRPNVVRAGQPGTVVSAAAAAGDLVNGETGQLRGGGVIEANVINRGLMTTTGEITGNVVNQGTARLRGTVGGDLDNRTNLQTTGALSVNSLINSGNTTIRAGHSLSALEASTNSGSLMLGGSFSGDLLNQSGGTFRLVNGATLTGNLENRGSFGGFGTITGQFTNLADLTLNQRDRPLTVGGGLVNGALLTVIGDGLQADVTNTASGRMAVHRASIDGELTNNGRVDLSGGRNTSSVLTVNGLKGDGIYRLDVDLTNMAADRIVVDGGAATGNYYFEFNHLTPGLGADMDRSVTILDIDESQGAANNFTYDADIIDAPSDRFRYSLDRLQSGDLAIISQLDPAIGSIFGNIALTHSLIGSVINRPTSPYVVGMAYEDTAKPCGIGSWGRAIGGHAEATGATDNGTSRVSSTVTADYYGMQVGTDLACFNGHFNGWNMAVGALLGVNKGDTSQPIYTISQTNSSSVTNVVSSINKTDFDQIYGGLYLTASKDRWTFDVQYRREKTDFEINNIPVNGTGIGLTDAALTSKAHTLSGAISYALPVGKSGWQVVPTAGFSWSKYDIDDLDFDDGFHMEFGDSQSKVGFLGGTLTKTFVQPADNSAINVFATGTYYKDFADQTNSLFTIDQEAGFRQNLRSDHLGSYTEVSLGANYVKVLSGQANRPRQLSAGTRIDARFGDNLDSVGVTGQLRLQF